MIDNIHIYNSNLSVSNVKTTNLQTSYNDIMDIHFTEIVPHLYLANINGVNQHNIVDNNISLIINSSNEITGL